MVEDDGMAIGMGCAQAVVIPNGQAPRSRVEAAHKSTLPALQ